MLALSGHARVRGMNTQPAGSRTISRSPLIWPLVTLPVAALATPLSFVLWRTPPGAATAPNSVIPLMLPVEVVIPAVAFGLGIAFLLVGRPLVRRNDAPRLSRAAHAGIAWLLLNWWPHSNFHRVAQGWTSLLAVDYVFHITVIASTVVVAAYFIVAMRGPREGQAR